MSTSGTDAGICYHCNTRIFDCKYNRTHMDITVDLCSVQSPSRTARFPWSIADVITGETSEKPGEDPDQLYAYARHSRQFLSVDERAARRVTVVWRPAATRKRDLNHEVVDAP